MFPPGYHQQFATTGAEPIGPGNATTVMITTSTHRFNAAASPSHSGFASSASLPKFGHAFGKRGAHMTEFNTPSPIPVNSLQDPQLQVLLLFSLMTGLACLMSSFFSRSNSR